jgi:hypothetical protein
MAVDIESRQRIGDAIRSYLNNEIDNFRFDDVLGECHSSDRLVNAIIESLWFLYDDCTRSHFRDNAAAAAALTPCLERWEHLLRSRVDFDEPDRERCLLSRPPRPGLWGKVNDWFYGLRPSFATNRFWPLSSAAEWNELGIPFDAPTEGSKCESR